MKMKEALMVGIALVTGATKGIGFEIVRQLTARRWSVCLTGRARSSVMQAAGTLGPSVFPVTLDVTSERSIATAGSAVR